MRLPVSVALAAVVAIAAPSRSAAQIVAGRVTDQTSGTPVAGVVVSAVSAGGDVLVRAVTDSASGFRIAVAPGMVKLQFRRIGFSPATRALADTVNGRLDVVLERLPTRLPPVKAVVAAQCESKTANNEDILALWEQARSGMLTSLVAREAKAAYTSVLLYQTSFNGDDELPRAVDRFEFSGTSTAFVAGGEPAALARDGYLVREGLGYSFLAPDDQVLFDETFLNTHCFTPEPATSDSLVGIHFESAKGVKKVGVVGTVWLRRNPLDLVSVEYRYTNLDKGMQRVNPGGSIQFRQMPNGITMVNQWRIRGATLYVPSGTTMARSAVVGRGGVPNAMARPASRRDPVVTANETGAMIEMMQWPGVQTYIAPMGSVSGVAVDKYSGKPLANTLVRFDRTPFKAVTDSVGAFTILDVLPGLYAADIGDPDLIKYGVESPLVGPVAIRYGPNTGVRLEGEGPAATIARGCDEKSDARVMVPKAIGGPSAIFGRVMAGRLAADGLSFRAEVSLPGMTAGSAPFTLRGKTDKLGRFRVCGLPPGGKVRVVTDERKTLMGVAELPVDPAKPFSLATIQLEPPKPPT